MQSDHEWVGLTTTWRRSTWSALFHQSNMSATLATTYLLFFLGGIFLTVTLFFTSNTLYTPNIWILNSNSSARIHLVIWTLKLSGGLRACIYLFISIYYSKLWLRLLFLFQGELCNIQIICFNISKNHKVFSFSGKWKKWKVAKFSSSLKT